jgi:hypothetical protein
VSSALPSPIAVQDLTASADYIDRWNVRRAGFRGDRLGLGGSTIEDARRPVWQAPFSHSDHSEPWRERNTAKAQCFSLRLSRAWSSGGKSRDDSRLCRPGGPRHDLSEQYRVSAVPAPAHIMRALAPARRPGARAQPSYPEFGTHENTGRPFWQAPFSHSDHCPSGGRGTRNEVSSALPSPIAIRDLAASADYIDRWNVRGAGFLGGRLGLRGGSLAKARRPVWQAPFSHSDHSEPWRERNTAKAQYFSLKPSRAWSGGLRHDLSEQYWAKAGP